jgi:hypothetical protein
MANIFAQSKQNQDAAANKSPNNNNDKDSAGGGALAGIFAQSAAA